MSYDLHILRVPESKENQISADEWLSCIASDPELQRRQSGDDPAGWIIATVTGAEEWESLRWREGWISASYPQDRMASKMSAIAQRLGAVLMGDDGDIWTITEDGRMVVDSPEDARATKSQPAKEEPLPRGMMWPYFNYDAETDPRRIIMWLLSCRPDSDITAAERFLSDRLQIPMHEAAAALRTCQSGQPVGMPAPEDIEEACLLCERLQELGIVNKGCGVQAPPW